ncbi:methyltransferase [Marinobacter sp. CHS3-4]|uniref:methyltransferase n=1 Tax=Marinobacter sp. CHS3-4 TaxID=3045174 RepID=UPI0024B5D5CB|nr:methyltransferase [Marinobacter sp. CHS3-4]MDI9244030.1 methyltransferase [Marinobacter sp. CHS3-4]
MSDSWYAGRWWQLNDWLLDHRPLWQPTPFTDPVPEWTRQWPDMADRIARMSDEDCQRFESDPVALSRELAALMPSLATLPELTDVPVFSGDEDGCTLPETRAHDMPGRKRLQSGAFASAVRPLNSTVVDWCCGKGHLARTLLPFSDHPVQGLEWNPALVNDGNRLAQKFGDSVTLRCQDVMANDLHLPGDAHAVALHACGDLHRRLLSRAANQRLPRVSIAPCCFHLSASNDYRPLSEFARHQLKGLALTKADLKLAVEETVTAPARVRDQVNTFSQWRLGFDGLQRSLRGVDEYLPVPSHPGWVGRGDFRQFC